MGRNYATPGARMLALAADRAVDASMQTAQLMGRSQISVGVTGLSRSGKTLFLTTAINNLLTQKRFELFSPISQRRMVAAQLDQPPHATTPRFQFEPNLDCLYADPPRWPQGTTRISQIRLRLKSKRRGLFEDLVANVGFDPAGILSVDMVDYPGEWLTDLPMLNQSFEQWSAQTLEMAQRGPRASLSGPWLDQLKACALDADNDQRAEDALARAYTDYLRQCKASHSQLTRLQPGRFLVPGDLEDAPALTFCPLPAVEALSTGAPAKSTYSRFRQRFEAYKSQVIAPFLDEHIARIDRQIVLVDLLSAINGGKEALEELQQTILEIAQVFRPGPSNPLATLIGGRRVERLLVAASKVDHLPTGQHKALNQLLEDMLAPARGASLMGGGEFKSTTLSALRAALPSKVTKSGKVLDGISGIPAGHKQAKTYFPGTLPGSWRELLDLSDQERKARFAALDFLPPRDLPAPEQGLPQIRVDQALDFLIGDLM